MTPAMVPPRFPDVAPAPWLNGGSSGSVVQAAGVAEQPASHWVRCPLACRRPGTSVVPTLWRLQQILLRTVGIAECILPAFQTTTGPHQYSGLHVGAKEVSGADKRNPIAACEIPASSYNTQMSRRSAVNISCYDTQMYRRQLSTASTGRMQAHLCCALKYFRVPEAHDRQTISLA